MMVDLILLATIPRAAEGGNMSVLINMEMPKDGFITITVTSDARVVGNSKKENGKFEYLHNEDIAKAVPVPPHGRLGDLDALEAYVMRLCTMAFREGNGPYHLAYGSLTELVSKAPTIIPAEEGE